MRVLPIALAVMLTGCASFNHVLENYQGVPIVEVTTKHDTFRIFDKPSEGKLMITSSMASALAQGFTGGLLLNPAATAVPKPVYQEGVEAFLTSTGRNCRILDGYLLIQPQWEFKYECDGSPIATSSIPSSEKTVRQ